MNILSLEIKDILSIEQAFISFDANGLVLVDGWNYDTSRANGAGKTAIFNSLSFGLYDKIPRKITASEIVRRGCKTGYVSVRIKHNDDIWTVHRSRPKSVKFFKNDIEQSITQIEFESLLKLNYNQFLLTSYIPQANSGFLERFLSSADADKKKFLLDLLNLEEFSIYKENCDIKIKDLSAQIQTILASIDATSAKIAAYSESLQDVEDIDNKISILDKKNLDYLTAVHSLSTVQKPDLSKFSKLESDIKNKQSQIMTAKSNRASLMDRYRELNSELKEQPSICLSCGQELASKDALHQHIDNQQKIKLKMASIKDKIDEYDSIILKETKINSLYRDLQTKKDNELSSYHGAVLKINELKSLIKNNDLEKNHLIKLKSNNDDLMRKIDTLTKKQQQDLIDLESLRNDLSIYQALSNIYSTTGAQAYILDSIVDSFNEIVQKYIDLLSPNMTYSINSYKETAKGETVAKFSETLTKNGNQISVGSLSGGEQKGLSLCIDFSLIEILESQFGMILNPIILDEPFDGLDFAGREIVINLLTELAHSRQILVIDHASEAKALFSKTIFVSLKNDVSSVKIDI